MSNIATQESREFQAEIKQLLDIVINSLYTDREIFLRELISNAADALEKLRYVMLTEGEIQDKDLALEINIELDEKEGTLSVIDTGIGMTAEELITNLGTIAHSGSKAFIRQLAQGDKRDLNLIGQFGVGFYSAFMVANKVKVGTQSYQINAKGQVWFSEGAGTYTVEENTELKRGTKVTLQIKEDAQEFLKPETIKQIIRQYSSFVPFPIIVNGEKVNTVEAIWTKNKNQVTDEEYNEFYKYIANMFDEPRFRLHFSADAPLSINALLFVPQDNLEQYGFGRMEPGVNLYCRKVLIQQQAEILPEWLRFVKGVVDSEELPLNISRETMQDSRLVAKLRKVLTGRFLKFLAEQSEKDAEKYIEFYEKFSGFMKEGAASDYTYRNELVKLLRFESSKTEPGKVTSLKEYLERMKDGQKAVYYLNGPNRKVIEEGPYLEIFRANDLEVIYTQEPVDDYIFSQLHEFEGKPLKSADQADLDLEKTTDSGENLTNEEIQSLSMWLKEALGDKVSEVKESKRLKDSPAILLTPEGMSASLQRVMQMMNKDADAMTGPKVLEINTAHPLVKSLNTIRAKDETFAKLAAEQIYDNAMISAGLMVDQRDSVNRIYKVLERALQ